MLDGVSFIVAIVLAIITQKVISKKMTEKKEFSGVGWGLLNGVVGNGVLWVIIVYIAIKNMIKVFKDKKYQEYCRKEMRKFAITYVMCLIVWIVILVLIRV